MQELHELQEEKLLLSQIKCKSSMEKTHRKSFKRASKHGNPDEVKTFTQQELTSLVSEQERKVGAIGVKVLSSSLHFIL